MVRCSNCGGDHVAWECHKPKRVAQPVAVEADRVVPAPVHPARKPPRKKAARAAALVAPPGECAYCDRRRDHIKTKVAAMRAAKKEQP